MANMWDNYSRTQNAGFFNGTNAGDTPSGPAKDKGGRRLQNVVPVCIRQLRDSKGEDFIFFGVKAQILTLVVILRDLDVSSTKATYKLEDHTGTITAVLWLDNDIDSSVNLPSVKEGHYCRIYGSLRTTEGVKTILILKMLPVYKINEVTTNLLETLHVRYATEKMATETNSSINIAQNNPSAELANSMSFMYDNSSTNDNNFTPIQLKVYNILKKDNNDNGLSRDFIKSHFPPGQHRDVNNALEYLSSEGHVYTTINEDHFKATD